MSWAPGLNLEGPKAAEMDGRYILQKMRSDDEITLNMVAGTIKDWQCQNLSVQASESEFANASVGIFFYPALRFYLSLIPLQRPQT